MNFTHSRRTGKLLSVGVNFIDIKGDSQKVTSLDRIDQLHSQTSFDKSFFVHIDRFTMSEDVIPETITGNCDHQLTHIPFFSLNLPFTRTCTTENFLHTHFLLPLIAIGPASDCKFLPYLDNLQNINVNRLFRIAPRIHDEYIYLLKYCTQSHLLYNLSR